MANELTKKQYLDLAGLKKFWGIVKDTFVSEVSLSVSDTTGATFTSKDGLGNVATVGTIPMASTTGAGLMSKDQVAALNSMSGNIENAIELNGVAFAGNAAKIGSIGSGENVKAKHVNLDVKYDSASKTIRVVDLNNGSAVLTSFDATAFIKDSFLSKAEITTQDGKTGLLLTFALVNPETGDKTKEPIFVDLTSFVDTYTAGNGLSLDAKQFSVKLATGEKYLKVDANGLATTGIDTAISTAAGAAQSAAETAAKGYTDALIGGALAAPKDGETATVKGYVDAGIADAKGYADGLINGDGGVDSRLDALEAAKHTHANKTVLDGISEAKVTAWDAAEGNAKGYTDARIGVLGKVSADAGAADHTVKTYVDAAVVDVKGYADTVAGNAYAAIEAISLDDITFEKLNA